MNEQELKIQFLQEYIRKISEDLKGQLISISFMSPADNSLILHKSVNPMVDNSQSSLYQMSILKSLTRAMDFFPGVVNHDIKLLSIAYQGQKHMIFFSPNRSIVAHVILEETANLKLVELVLKTHMRELLTQLTARAGVAILGQKIDLRI